jgi:MFS family permease
MENQKAITVSRSAWFTLGILSSTLLVVFFSETMLLPAIPEIMQDFRIPYGTAAWIFSAYLIVAAVMTPIAGKMSDIYGKKKVLLTLLALYVAGITAGGFANNISFLLASRIVQGVGLAAVPAAFSLLRDTFPPAKLAIAVGVFGSLGRGQHHPEFWMAHHILLHSAFCGRSNAHDRQIRKGKQAAACQGFRKYL